MLKTHLHILAAAALLSLTAVACGGDDDGESGGGGGETSGTGGESGGTDSNPYDMDGVLDEDAVAAGKTLYDDNCASCHGDDGSGSASFPGILEAAADDSDAELYDVIYNGAEDNPVMIAFGDTLGEDGTWQTVTYLRSLAQ